MNCLHHSLFAFPQPYVEEKRRKTRDSEKKEPTICTVLRPYLCADCVLLLYAHYSRLFIIVVLLLFSYCCVQY